MRSLLFLLLPVTLVAQTPVQLVNPFVGTTNGGNTFPGATLPFGMVKLGPDCRPNGNGGYNKEKPVDGFSHLHASGTGGAPKYGNILVAPFTGTFVAQNTPSPYTAAAASPGYFAMHLTRPDVRAELTVTHSVGLHRYTFPAAAQTGGICIDAGHFLDSPVDYETQKFVGSEVEIVSPTEVRGYNRVRGGWNIGDAYTVYFYAIFDRPCLSRGTFRAGQTYPGQLTQTDEGKPVGAYFTFDTKRQKAVTVKVGISFISANKAKANVGRELPGFDFAATKAGAEAIWNRELSKVALTGGTPDQRRMFYTALYFSQIMPSDRTGENPKWTSGEPYYDDFYTIWDTFRATMPLHTLLSPSREAAIARSLIDCYKHEGYLPDGRSGNSSGRVQGGTNADVFLADLFVKGVEGVDYKKAYEAVRHDAEVAAGGDQQKEGRGGLVEYKALGYVPQEYEPRQEVFLPPIYNLYERGGSRTLEYAHNDFCVATLAKAFGTPTETATYLSRANNWKNLWRPLTFEGATGFIWPRRKDGSWHEDFSPLKIGSWGNFFYESSSWEYSLFVPHDVKGLIAQCGGPEAFTARLDTLFKKGYYNLWNEPSFLVPCLYNYVGKPHCTAEIVSKLLRTRYLPTEGGIPGNDDAGSMTAWFAFHSMGFFPVAGQDVYLISSPLFPKVDIRLENGKTFTIEARNQSDANPYVQSATLNGQPLNQSWFRHTAIKNGGTLVLEMGPTPSQWATGNPPPSMSE